MNSGSYQTRSQTRSTRARTRSLAKGDSSHSPATSLTPSEVTGVQSPPHVAEPLQVVGVGLKLEVAAQGESVIVERTVEVVEKSMPDAAASTDDTLPVSSTPDQPVRPKSGRKPGRKASASGKVLKRKSKPMKHQATKPDPVKTEAIIKEAVSAVETAAEKHQWMPQDPFRAGGMGRFLGYVPIVGPLLYVFEAIGSRVSGRQ